MRVALPSRVRRAAPWVAGAVVTFALAYPVTLEEPYHYDTSAYMKTIKLFLASGEVSIFYPTRPVAAYALMPLAVVAGQATLALTMAMAFAGAALLSALFFRQTLGLHPALTGVLFTFTTPAALITATHGKEDFVAVALVMGSGLLLLRGQAFDTILAGVLFGLALLTKELLLLVSPLALGLAWVGTLPASLAWRDLRNLALWRTGTVHALILLAASTGTLFAVSSEYWVTLMGLVGSPEIGQFRGLFSEFVPVGLRAWKLGTGRILFFGQALAILIPLVDMTPKRKLCALVLVAEAVASGVYLVNNTSLHYRHFLWPALFSLPVAALVAQRGIGAVLELLHLARRFSAVVLYALVAVTAAQSLLAVMPAILLRKAYNPVARFYTGIRSHGENALMLGMDNCIHVEYFADRECWSYPPTVTVAQAEAFAAKVERIIAAGRPVYLLPDFFAYDFNGHMVRAMQARFTMERGEMRWHEDYHTMDFGYTRDEARQYLLGDAGDCRAETTEHAAAEEIGAPLVIQEFVIQCAAAPSRRVLISMTRGRVLSGFWKTGLQRLVPRQASGRR